MKNKLDQLFETKEKDILSIYFTAGYPKINDTISILKTLQQNNVDLIEIGIPYSDPLADGPVIQKANQIAIENGMSLSLVFEQLNDAKSEIYIPVILMGYLNVILQFGVEHFYEECSNTNISAVIIPDLPIEEYLTHHKTYAEKHAIKNVFLITPTTLLERIKLIDTLSSPFIYVVSSNSITGNSITNFNGLRDFYIQLNKLQLKNKTLIGFGINNSTKFEDACFLSNGAIIGSAFIKVLENKQAIPEFIHSIIKTKTIAV